MDMIDSSPNMKEIVTFDDTQPAFTDLPNKILLNYKLINFIGEGAFG
jgi:hypothetical protein